MSLFLLAILTPEEIDRQVKEWKEYMREHYECEVALRSPAHITLIPPFSMKKERIPPIEALLRNFSKQQQDFNITLRNFSSFAPRVIFVHVVPNKALENIKKQLETLLLAEAYPIKKEDRPFHPHVTIANRDLKKHDFSPAWKHFQDMQYEADFDAGEITLLKHDGVWNTVSGAKLPGK